MLTKEEIELLKEYEKNTELIIQMIDYNYNKVKQSPEFGKPGILHNIQTLNDGTKYGLLALQSYSYLLHSTAERGDIIELQELIRGTTGTVEEV